MAVNRCFRLIFTVLLCNNIHYVVGRKAYVEQLGTYPRVSQPKQRPVNTGSTRSFDPQTPLSPSEPEISLNNNGFIDRYSRIGFIRKVYSIFTYQALLTAMIASVILNNQNLGAILKRNIQSTVAISFIGQLLTSFSLILSPNLRFKFPVNIIILTLYTIFQSFIVGLFASSFDPKIVFMGTLQTFLVFLVMTLFSFQVIFIRLLLIN